MKQRVIVVVMMMMICLIGNSAGQISLDGQQIHLNPCEKGNDYQVWYVENGGLHKILLPRLLPGLWCFDCDGCAEGATPHLWQCLASGAGYENQELVFEPSSGLIRSLNPESANSTCVQAAGDSQGSLLQMSGCDASDPASLWSYDFATGLISAKSSGLCWDATFVMPPAAGCFQAAAQSLPWCDATMPPAKRSQLLLNAMSQDDKDALVHGVSGYYVGNTPANLPLAIPSLNMNDGPQGFRGEPGTSTQWPCALSIAASWDPIVAQQWGALMGQEFVGKGANVQLGPGVNVDRVPVDGRNFEYISGEDPFLGYVMAGAAVRGIQSQGVVANAKHYINNNQETNRTTISANLDERTRMEIYAQPFAGAVDAGVWSIMCSYNRINDTYACENDLTLNTELKGYLGFQGWVMSDWGATHSTVPSAVNGLDQEMPDNQYYGSALLNAIQSGNVSQAQFDDHVYRILLGMFSMGLFDNEPTGNVTVNVTSPAHNEAARQLAQDGTILLTNRDNFLPLQCSRLTSIAFFNAPSYKAPITGGDGSGAVTPAYQISPLEGVSNYLKQAGITGVTISYYNGSDASQAAQLASSVDLAIPVLATTSSEGIDRPNLDLPGYQVSITNAVAAANPNTVALVISPGAALLPFAEQVAATLLMFLPGQEEGNAFAEILCGAAAPGGRLPITIPNINNEVNFSVWQYPGVANEEYYTEKLEIGYRWYTANNVVPHFPFGFGLTYTTFSFSDLRVSPTSVTCFVQNTGSRAGQVVAQLYLQYPDSAGEPPLQLRGFVKLNLQPGQSALASFPLTPKSFSIWDVNSHRFEPVAGQFGVFVGGYSADPNGLSATLNYKP